MQWQITYFNENVVQGILNWPKKILAKYLRIIDLMEIEGPNLGMPFTKPIEMDYLRLGLKVMKELDVRFFVRLKTLK